MPRSVLLNHLVEHSLVREDGLHFPEPCIVMVDGRRHSRFYLGLGLDVGLTFVAGIVLGGTHCVDRGQFALIVDRLVQAIQLLHLIGCKLVETALTLGNCCWGFGAWLQWQRLPVRCERR